MMGYRTPYSRLDRAVHRLALGQLEMQKTLSRLEDRVCAASIDACSAARPVFVTSLPRAGTTLLLEILTKVPEFVSHTYRNMPYLACPLLWDRLSRPFRSKAELQERAHGDGMAVGYDSVEAFEEILWRAFWPEHFGHDRIRPWPADARDENGEFRDFFSRHMRKVVSLRRAEHADGAQRYVSKNNSNIGRIGWIARHFPDATIVIPYREPFAQVYSLARQHANFLSLHEQDSFALEYMETIGHFEFGRALRPIDFDGWLSKHANLERGGLEFWAQYWLTAYASVLCQTGPHTVLLSYDRLCRSPAKSLHELAAQLGAAGSTITGQTPALHAAGVPSEELPIAAERKRRMKDLAAELDRLAIN